MEIIARLDSCAAGAAPARAAPLLPSAPRLNREVLVQYLTDRVASSGTDRWTPLGPTGQSRGVAPPYYCSLLPRLCSAPLAGVVWLWPHLMCRGIPFKQRQRQRQLVVLVDSSSSVVVLTRWGQGKRWMTDPSLSLSWYTSPSSWAVWAPKTDMNLRRLRASPSARRQASLYSWPHPNA